jgi:hypothetical protein
MFREVVCVHHEANVASFSALSILSMQPSVTQKRAGENLPKPLPTEQ